MKKLTPLTPPKFTMVQKLVASYATIMFFTLAALLFSISGLYSITTTARDIARNDLLVINSALKLRESLVAQERASGKFAILKSPEFIELFRQRQDEFNGLLATLKPAGDRREMAALEASYQKYQSLVENLFSGVEGSEPRQKQLAADMLRIIDAVAAKGQQQLSSKLEEAERKEQATVRYILILSFTGFLLATGVAAFVVITISTAIRRLKTATHRIAEGDFDYDPQIPEGDEIGDLARDFTSMAARLKVLEQMSLDASPLTRLPGNIAIERALSKRLHSGEQFAVCYADLDNFKAYNDRYGYVKASEVIKLTGEMIHDVAQSLPGHESFVGHVGGDDFVIITDADNAATACERLTARFDEEIRHHYNKDDLDKGAIEGLDRYGVHRTFPIMTVSIAAVICDKGSYDSAVDIAKTAADLKDYLKAKSGSNYFINRRSKQR